MLQNEASNGCDIAPQLPKRRGPGRPFVKGDPRCNRKGRPRSFDAVRALAVQLANEKDDDGALAITNLLRSWRDSKEPSLQQAFVAYAFGKVPDKLEATGIENKTTLVLHFDHERGIMESANGR